MALNGAINKLALSISQQLKNTVQKNSVIHPLKTRKIEKIVMILISVKSPFMDIKHQEHTDAGAEKYLRATKKLHQQYLENNLGKRPNEGTPEWFKWRRDSNEAKLKVEIINTDANQLNLSI